MLGNLKGGYSDLWKAIIRPPRDEYSIEELGCGLSEGEYISLGWYEREDVDLIVTHLRNSGKVSTIGLWGRSMGAVTALMHADRDPSIAGLVLDSPFASLRQLAEDLCKQHTKIPKFVMSGAMAIIKSTVQSKAKFDLNDLNPLKNHVSKAFIPALFVCCEQDEFVNAEHTKSLHKAYAGDKNLIIVDGGHNTPRPQFMLDSVGIFFYNTLQVEYLVPQQKKSAGNVENRKKSESSEELEVGQRANRRVGNHDDVQDALYGFHKFDQVNDNNYQDEDALFEEQMRIAMEESAKESSNKSSSSNSMDINNNSNNSSSSINPTAKQAPTEPVNKPSGDSLDQVHQDQLDKNNNDIQEHVDVDWVRDHKLQRENEQKK